MQVHLDNCFPVDKNPSVRFQVITAPSSAPASINSVSTSVLSAASAYSHVLDVVDRVGSVDAIIVACFSAHPLVHMLRESREMPVVGIMEAGLLMGSQLGGKTGIVTTDARWEPLLEHECKGELGLERQCGAGVMSSGLTVLELETAHKETVHQAVGKTALRMVRERNADVILLGCAGMVGLDKVVQACVGEQVTVLDPVICAANMAMALARMGVKTAKSGRYDAAS